MNLRLLRPERNALDQTEPHGEAEPERSDGTPSPANVGQSVAQVEKSSGAEAPEERNADRPEQEHLASGRSSIAGDFSEERGQKNGRGERI